jgi:tetratricopeptide (TPR) repeat protein
MSILRTFILVLCLLVVGATISTAGDKNYKELYRQGAEHYKKGEYDDAIRLYSMAIELRPNSVILLFRRGCAYEKNKQYDNAISDLNKAIVLEPEYTDAYYVRGMAYMNKGQKHMAADDFKKACDMGWSDACGKLK